MDELGGPAHRSVVLNSTAEAANDNHITITQVEKAQDDPAADYSLDARGKAASHPTTENMMDSNQSELGLGAAANALVQSRLAAMQHSQPSTTREQLLDDDDAKTDGATARAAAVNA